MKTVHYILIWFNVPPPKKIIIIIIIFFQKMQKSVTLMNILKKHIMA